MRSCATDCSTGKTDWPMVSADRSSNVRYVLIVVKFFSFDSNSQCPTQRLAESHATTLAGVQGQLNAVQALLAQERLTTNSMRLQLAHLRVQLMQRKVNGELVEPDQDMVAEAEAQV